MVQHILARSSHVLGSTVTVELDASLAGVAPIYKGHLLLVGQIGSLVRIPQGLVDLVGSVVLLGISELAGVQEPSQAVQNGDRWLQVQLLGEVDRSTGRFQRGVGSYPGLDDPVHFHDDRRPAGCVPRSRRATQFDLDVYQHPKMYQSA